MRWLESIAVHLLLALIVFFMGAVLLNIAVTNMVSSDRAFSDYWIWVLWGAAAILFGFFMPGLTAKRQVWFWLRQMASTGKKVDWERYTRRVLSWLDSGLLWQWERIRLIPTALKEFEPYFRTESPGAAAYRNLLKILHRYNSKDTKYRNLLVNSYLTQGIISIDDARIIGELWDDNNPNTRLGDLWVEFGLAQKIDAHWMEDGYRWALEQRGKHSDNVARLLLPRLMARKRTDDLAAMVYLQAQESAASDELIRALMLVVRDHQRISRSDELARDVKRVLEGMEDVVVDLEEEEDLDVLVTKVKPGFGGFVWRSVTLAVQKGLLVIWNSIRVILRVVQWVAGKVRLPAIVTKWRVPVIIGVLVVIIGWAIIQLLPSGGSTGGQDLTEVLVYHSDLPFAVQVAAYREQEIAEQKVMELWRQGEEAYWQKTDGESVWYRVRVGGFASLEAAKHYAEDLMNRKLIDNYYIANFSDGYYRNP